MWEPSLVYEIRAHIVLFGFDSCSKAYNDFFDGSSTLVQGCSFQHSVVQMFLLHGRTHELNGPSSFLFT